MTLTLSDAEIREITGRKRKDAQRRELTHLGIPFTTRSDGSPLVYRSAIDAPKEEEPKSPRLRLPQPRRVLPRHAREVGAPGD